MINNSYIRRCSLNNEDNIICRHSAQVGARLMHTIAAKEMQLAGHSGLQSALKKIIVIHIVQASILPSLPLVLIDLK